jgi:hypothetical protein
MMDPRPLGIVLAIVGAVGTAVSALADPLGIGEGNTFGWLQITGVIIGAIVILLGLVIAAEWVPLPGRASSGSGTAGGGSAPQTTVITDSSREEKRPTT